MPVGEIGEHLLDKEAIDLARIEIGNQAARIG